MRLECATRICDTETRLGYVRVGVGCERMCAAAAAAAALGWGRGEGLSPGQAQRKQWEHSSWKSSCICTMITITWSSCAHAAGRQSGAPPRPSRTPRAASQEPLPAPPARHGPPVRRPSPPLPPHATGRQSGALPDLGVCSRKANW